MQRTRRIAVGALVAFGVLAVVGLVVTVVAVTSPATFGWAAYAPEQDLVLFPPGVMLVSTSVVVGVCLTVVGLVGASGVLGYLIGSGAAASDSL